jgi:acetyl coenzyme A synthetase (ADP forming)-like protein
LAKEVDLCTSRDGTTLFVRQARAGDREGLTKFLNGFADCAAILGVQSRSCTVAELADTIIGGSEWFCLVGEKDGSIIAQAGYHGGPDTADAEVLVAQSFRGKGIGMLMLQKLAHRAAASSVRVLQVTVEASRYAILDRMKEMGFLATSKILPGKIRVSFLTTPHHGSMQTFEHQEASATSATVKHFFRPRSIAVVGASREKGTIGGELFRNLLDGDFNGPVYPVNRNAPVVQSVAAYKSVLDCPGPVDLAFIVVPARFVIDVAKECAQKGVRALVVISSGFAETGEDGAALQDELVRVCRDSGMRMIGPNCMGIINTDPQVRLNGQFAPYRAIPGRIGFWSQSGALGIAVIDLANQLGIGLSEFVSAGNRADVSGNDILHYWENNDNVGVILLYIESFGDPRRFARLAKRITKKKPIVAVKSGRSSAGFRATQSHTGALLAASDVTVDALFKQSGVIRTDSLDEMFDVAALLATQPVPGGDKVAILTNAGGAGILAADACESSGLKVPELSLETQARLKSFLLPIASTRNPVDMSGGATPANYGQAIAAIAEDQDVDSLMVIFIPPLAERPEEVASEILGAVKAFGRKIPIISTFMATKGVSGQLTDGTTTIPAYPFPELAVQALARVTEYGRSLAGPPGVRPSFDVNRSEATSFVARALESKDGWMGPADMDAFLRCYGIKVARSVEVKARAEAAAAASHFSGKVALKAIAPGLLHKTEAGAVKVGLSAEEVESNATEMEEHLRRNGYAVSGFLVQEMVPDAVEMFVGVTHDPTFGPVIACGAGGTLVELIKDVSVGLTPLEKPDATRMVHSLRTFQILTGYRGGARYDVMALEETILRLGQMVEEIPEVAELDLNPLMVMHEGMGAVVVDSRIRVADGSQPGAQTRK